MNAKLSTLFEQLNCILIGKTDKTKLIVSTLLAGGHILLEDMPGVGKTVVSKSLSLLISDQDNVPIKFSRIQGTPDLLPYDITGVDIYDAKSGSFNFCPGPIFTNILLADELNRATPKVQSALLQAMAEKIVTVGNKTYNLPENFFVIATQNPIDCEGTFQLPSAQLDRFMCCIDIGYPDIADELRILTEKQSDDKLLTLEPVISISEIKKIQAIINNIHIDEKILRAIVNICDATRHDKRIKLGLSTRAAIAFKQLLQSWAYLNERDYVIDQDLIDTCQYVLPHRIICSSAKISKTQVVIEIVADEIKKIVWRD